MDGLWTAHLPMDLATNTQEVEGLNHCNLDLGCRRFFEAKSSPEIICFFPHELFIYIYYIIIYIYIILSYIYLGGRKLNNFLSEPKTCERPKTRDIANLKTIWEFVTLWHAASAQAKLPCGGRIPPYLDVPLKPVCNWIDFEHVLSYH